MHFGARLAFHSALGNLLIGATRWGLELDGMMVDVAKFERDGFLAFDRIASDETISEIARRYDQMLSGEVDCSPTDRKLGRVTRQIMSPSRYHPTFEANAARDAGREIAKRLLSTPEPAFVFDMLIYKEPGQTATTPWHQDMAYAAVPFVRPGRVDEAGNVRAVLARARRRRHR